MWWSRHELTPVRSLQADWGQQWLGPSADRHATAFRWPSRHLHACQTTHGAPSTCEYTLFSARQWKCNSWEGDTVLQVQTQKYEFKWGTNGAELWPTFPADKSFISQEQSSYIHQTVGGSMPDCSSLHVNVSLGTILNCMLECESVLILKKHSAVERSACIKVWMDQCVMFAQGRKAWFNNQFIYCLI